MVSVLLRSLWLLGASLAWPHLEIFENSSNAPVPIDNHAAYYPPQPALNNTWKWLGTAADVESCTRKCLNYTNTAASPVSGWSRCRSFTWESHTGACSAVVDEFWSPVGTSGSTTGLVTWPPTPFY